jgi:predicted HTH transcriptional regulator
LVPQKLGDWTFEAIRDLCEVGQFESDRHDFKFNVANLHNPSKVCCAFANTLGGFIILGVKDTKREKFEIVGLDADKELFGHLRAKVRADPEIQFQVPKPISIPGSGKLLYVIEVLLSPLRPHLPSTQNERVFWKRHGSDCVQMTLEEIRYQMNNYEEKREKLALLLIDLHHQLRKLESQASAQDGQYDGYIFSFGTIDRVVVETYAFLKGELQIFGALNSIRDQFMLLNAEKQKLLTILAMSYQGEYKKEAANLYRQTARNIIPHVTTSFEQIQNTLKDKFGIVNPYRPK